MILCKIMTGSFEEVKLLLQSKHALKYASVNLQAMSAIMQAHQAKSL